MVSILSFLKRVLTYSFGLTREDTSFLILLFISLSLFLSGQILPQDDYWRHLASALGRDYSSLYFDSYVPKINLWIGYEKLLSLLGEKAYILLQSFTLVCFSLAFYLGTRGAPPNLRNACFLLLMVILQGRIATARPAVVLSGLFALLWVMESRKLRLLLSFLFAPFYWLFFIYLIPLLLKERLVFIPLLSGFVFWLFYGGEDYFQELLNILRTSAQKTMPVSENAPLWNVFMSKSWFSFLPPLLIVHYYGFKAFLSLDRKSLLAGLFFSLSNQIRYFVDNVSFLLLLFVRFLKRDIPEVVVLLLFPLIFVSAPTTKDIRQDLSFLENRKVIVADFNPINFILAYRVKNIKLSPPMEIEWANREVKEIIKDVKLRNTLSCETLKKTTAEVLIEKDLKGTKPGCLRLVGLLGEYRVWEVLR